MAPLIINEPKANFYLVYYTPTPTVLNLGCYVVGFEITPSTDDIDVGVFCAPSLTDTGRTTYTSVATLLWEPALYALLQPKVGQTGVFKFVPYSTDQYDYLWFYTRFASQPWGRFEVGQRVEVELPLAVLSTPAWVLDDADGFPPAPPA